jgi:hypothetical protein
MADIINNAGEGTVGLPQVSAPSVTTDKLYNVAGTLTFAGVAVGGGGGLSNIVEDLTPQLGGALDVNNFDIVGKPAVSTTAPGGRIDIIAADAGQAVGSYAEGGDVTIAGGDSGPYGISYSGYEAGRVTITGGSNGYYGGKIASTAGNSSPVTTLGGDYAYSFGGAVVISAGKGYAYNSGAAGSFGGFVSISSAIGTTYCDAGNVTIQSGRGVSADSGPGELILLAGRSDPTTGTVVGGRIRLTAGPGPATIGGGYVLIQGGRTYDSIVGSASHGGVVIVGGYQLANSGTVAQNDSPGGTVTITGGKSNTGEGKTVGTGGVGGLGGTVAITGGDGQQTAGGATPMYGGPGGPVTVTGGAGIGGNPGGIITITGGASNSTDGSTVTVTGGAGGTYAGAGGAVTVAGGDATLIGAGGAVAITAGDGTGDGTAGIAEVTNFRAFSATAISGGERFHLDDPTTPYYVWFTLDGAGADPAPGGRTSIGPVAILTGDGPDAVDNKIATAIALEADFGATPDQGHLTVTNANVGAVANAVDIDSTIGIQVEIQGADSPSTDGGDITLTPGAAGATGSAGAIVIPTTTAPTVTTNKLYNVAGALTWDGTDLTAGGGGGTSIVNASGSTKVDVEEGAADDTIRMDVGDQTGFPAADDVFLLRSSGLTIALPTATGSTTVGAPISLTAGTGGANRDGGDVTLDAGEGGATYGDGGYVNITAGNSSVGNYAGGGGINILAGNSDSAYGVGDSTDGGAVNIRGGAASLYGTGGDVNIVGGSSNLLAVYNSAGDALVRGGSGVNGTNGGSATLFGGGATGTATGGNAILIGGNAGALGTAGHVLITASSITAGHQVELRFRQQGGVNHIALDAPPSLQGDVLWHLPGDDTGLTNSPSSGNILAIDLGEYTVATLPDAGSFANCWALATDASGGRTVVRSDGTNWKVISVEGATVA